MRIRGHIYGGLAVLCLTIGAAPAAAGPQGTAVRRPPLAHVASAAPQTSASIAVQATDSLGGALPGASVTATGPLPAQTVTTAVTDVTGQATLTDLAPGRYRVVVELSGFETSTTEVDVAAGRQVRDAVVLPLATFAQHVTVTVDQGEQQLEHNFTETFPAEEIDQLPDDPDEAMELIGELAGPDAEIRMNGFQGDNLPPKSQIQSIRVRHDPYAPDTHGAGHPRVDVITKPGTSEWEQHVNVALRDESLDARNPFSPTPGEGRTRRMRWSGSGPLVKDRTSLSYSLSSRNAFDVQPIVAALPGRTVSNTANQENGGLEADVRLEHALTDRQMLRLQYERRTRDRENLGVGQFSLPEHAYDTNASRHLFRASGMGPIGQNAYNELRLEAMWNRDDRASRSQAVTIDVPNAVTSGGAQLGGGTRAWEVELGDDFELAFSNRHKVRFGFEGEFGRVRSNLLENANGRFTFASLDAFSSGTPLQFVQRVGNPSLAYSRYEFGWYAYDELKPRKNIQVGLGLRHEFQSFTNDWANFGPRASIAWNPERVKGLTVRAGAGLFYDWYGADLYEDTLRLDGVRQRELIVIDPTYPDPFAGAGQVVLPPPSVVRASDDLQLPTTRRMSMGFQYKVNPSMDVRVNVFGQSTSNRLRALDVNAPVDGVRPDPAFARITEIRSIGKAQQRGFDASLGLRAFDRRLFGMIRYRYARAFDDADGPLSLPASSSNLAAEWGPSSNDIRHRIFSYVRARLPFGIGLGVGTQAASGAPYTIRTGFDDNGDAVLNDRPAGVGRNSARGDWHVMSDMRLGWTIGGNDGLWGRGRQRERGSAGRGVEIYADVDNLLNTPNFTSYSNVLTSPYFGRPTAALPGRRIELGLRVFF
jgi:outer membrane receptor for ferrienterochelin and colicin